MSKVRNADRPSDPFRVLESSSSVVIDQQSNVLESCCKCFGCCCADTQNSYAIQIKGQNDSTVAEFYVKEDSSCCARAFCNPNHALKLHVSEAKGKPDLLTIDRPFSCCCFAIGPCQKDIIVRRSPDEVIGYVAQPCCGGCLTPTLDMFTAKKGDRLGTIKGPCCCIAGCCKSDFDILSQDGQEMARLRRGGVKDRGVGRSLLSTADKYKLQFAEGVGANAAVDDKLCWFKLCELYCCGCAVPFRVKCCIDDVVESQLPG